MKLNIYDLTSNGYETLVSILIKNASEERRFFNFSELRKNRFC